MRQLRRHHHATAHGLAVQPLAKAQAGLDGVAKGVAKIQNRPQARLALVLPHHPGLDFTTALHRVHQGLRIARHQGVDVGLNPVQKHHVGNRSVFDDFSQARTHLARGQCLQAAQVADHARRLVKRANHVFAQGMVDSRFAADRRVHLRQQGGGHLHKGHAAHVASRRKAGHVAHHAAAQREQHSLAVTALRQQHVKHLVQGLPCFVRLAIGQGHLVNLGIVGLQRLLQCRSVKRPHRIVGHDQGRAGLGQALPSAGLRQQTGANQNGVAALAQGNLNFDRGGVFKS